MLTPNHGVDEEEDDVGVGAIEQKKRRNKYPKEGIRRFAIS